MLEHLVGMKPAEFARRHMQCTTDQQILQTMIDMEERGQTKTHVERDHNQFPTGWLILPGGDRKIIRGRCNHPEDIKCGFDMPDDEIVRLLAKATPAKPIVEAEPTAVELVEASIDVVADEEEDDFPEAAEDECPVCGSTEVETLDKAGRFLRCTVCFNTGTKESFVPTDDESGDPRPIAPSSLETEPADEEPDEEPILVEPAPMTEAEDLARQFAELFGG